MVRKVDIGLEHFWIVVIITLNRLIPGIWCITLKYMWNETDRQNNKTTDLQVGST